MPNKAGTYRAKVDSWGMGESKNGHPQMELQFLITQGQFEGEKVRHFVYFVSEANSKISLDTLKTCGWNGVLDGNFEGLGTKEVELVMEWETYNGKDYLRVKWINDPDNPRAGSKPLDDAGKSAFMATLAALTGGMVAAPTAPEKRVDADDIPF